MILFLVVLPPYLLILMYFIWLYLNAILLILSEENKWLSEYYKQAYAVVPSQWDCFGCKCRNHNSINLASTWINEVALFHWAQEVFLLVVTLLVLFKESFC